jgi:deazaflavin-dependent oxidoreductase (nitroreductase family)
MSLVSTAGFEQKFFRRLNAVVEPAVRRGIASPTLLPGAMIVLESIGFKSGVQRSTPLVSFRIGRYRIVSTVRGDRSFWVKNLVKKPSVSYFLGGKRRQADAIVLMDGEAAAGEASYPRFLSGLVKLLSNRARNGVAIVILSPQSGSAD